MVSLSQILKEAQEAQNINFVIKFVDGEAVRAQEIEFALGGHYLRYPNLIPANEIWIEDSLSAQDAKAVIVHECIEYLIMALFGLDYDSAHDIASGIEARIR